MEAFDWIIVLITILAVCLGFLLNATVNAIEEACEDVGGKFSGSLDCRKGNEFYEIYPTNKWSLFDYTVNKYPKTEKMRDD